MKALSVKNRKKLSVKFQILVALLAIISAVALPQILHLIGNVSGIGSAIGEVFLPMHLPVMLVGLLAGKYVGAVVGFLSPIISFALTGMPRTALLPFMVIELCVYGLCAGIICNAKMPTVLKVLITQFAGRAVRAIAIVVAFYGFSSTAIPVSIIWNSIVVGLIGIILQLVILPLVVYRVDRIDNNAK